MFLSSQNFFTILKNIFIGCYQFAFMKKKFTFLLLLALSQFVFSSLKAQTAAISGPSSVCEGRTITLNDATPGGTWSSSNTSNATVGINNGFVSGISAGTTTISYTASASTVTYTV